ncbi:nucleotidyltransferase domain-containing protein [Patescibacteria group bacterium]|nr:MAG: nucleotidyltransferase domain-containing protein [Patescibacteria group bacterium]
MDDIDKTAEQEIKKLFQSFVDFKKNKVFVFGSRARGRARKFSDYDIGILGRRPLSSEKMALIKDAFEESNLPYRVDVVDFSTVSKKFKNIALKKIKKL